MRFMSFSEMGIMWEELVDPVKGKMKDSKKKELTSTNYV